jgi:hypothetical protein
MHPSDELNQSPLLWQLKQQVGQEPLEAPDGYFEAMAQAWDDRLADEEVMAQAPRLQQAGRQLPWRVPPGYFAALPDRIMPRLSQPEATAKPLWPGLVYRIAAVAAVWGLLWVLWHPSIAPAPPATALSWNDLSTEALLAFAEVEVDDPSLILAVMGEAPLLPPPVPQDPAVEAWLDEVDVADLEAALLAEEYP